MCGWDLCSQVNTSQTFLKQVAEKFVEPLQIFIPLFKNVYV